MIMTQARRFPRRDPLLLFRLQTDSAAGLAPAQIAEKHALSLYVVTQALRRGGNGRLPDPYLLSRRERERERGDATLVYWIGFIAACGSVFDGPNPTLVLDIDTDDLTHVHTLVEDLCDGRPGLESCQSSTRGLQVYIRDRNLGRLLGRSGDRSGTGGLHPSWARVPLRAWVYRRWTGDAPIRRGPRARIAEDGPACRPGRAARLPYRPAGIASPGPPQI